MAPRKTIAEQLRARLPPVRGDPEESGDDEQGDFEHPLNQQGSTEFDTIVGTPSRKDECFASGSASVASTRVTVNPRMTLFSDRALIKSS